MKKFVVDNSAVRQFLREVLSNPEVGWDSSGSLDNSPVTVSSVIDPSAVLTNPDNPNYRPNNRVELRTTLGSFVNDVDDSDADKLFDIIRDAMNSMKEKDDNMKKEEKKVEEAIRLAVRKMLSETSPYRDTGMSYSGPMTGASSRSDMEDCETCEGSGVLPDGAMCSACKGEGEVPAKKKRGYQMADTEAGAATFDDIAKEMGYAGPPGARQAVDKAMKKAQFIGSMDPDDLQILTLNAMNDYVDMLKKSGELTASDVKLMKDHPNIVSELDGFREFLDKYIKSAMKG